MGLRGLLWALAAVSLSTTFAPGLSAQKRFPRAGAAPARSSNVGTVRSPTTHVPERRTPIEDFETLSSADQRKALDRLPEGQRKQLQQRLDEFHQLPAEQQRALISFYNRLHQLPDQKQDAVRKAWNKFADQPRERQQVIREELHDMAGLSNEDRKAELLSAAFKSRFSKKEQDIVRDMEPLLPEQ